MVAAVREGSQRDQPGGGRQADFNETILRWAEWASDVVEEWPDDLRTAPPAQGAFEEVVTRASGSGG